MKTLAQLQEIKTRTELVEAMRAVAIDHENEVITFFEAFVIQSAFESLADKLDIPFEDLIAEAQSV